ARLVTPYQQGKWYADNLPYSIRPRRIIVCNFGEIRVYDQDCPNPEKEFVSISLEELPEKLFVLSFLANKSESRYVKEKELSVQAGEIVGRLYRSFAAQYANIETDAHEQRSLNVLLVRLVFLLFAEDAGLLQKHQAFLRYMENTTTAQMRKALIDLFRILDTPYDLRDPYEDPELLAFPYVNGGLFADEGIVIPQFTEQIREDLLTEASAGFDWKDISPTIFGAAFESTLNPDARRSGGMHYTSVENIHKVIDPLFLDDLRAELAAIEGEKVERTRNAKLRIFQKKLSELTFLDPAAGSHNFLTETYISLRKLELRVIEDLQGDQSSILGDAIMVSIGQFYAIEINDFAVSVGKTALWIAEQQMMERTQELLPYREFDFLPLKGIANSMCGNALRIDWNDVLPAGKCSYIIGNPPFLGAKMQSAEQRSELHDVFRGAKRCGTVDYVSGWYMKAAEYMGDHPIRCAFVSTNSICQGEQVATIWKPIADLGVHIDFAHDTFRWRSEASDQAHVFVVIVGFSKQDVPKRLFHHPSPDGDALVGCVSNINPYLFDAPSVLVWNRSRPICDVPAMGIGNKPIDGGNYIFKADERDDFLAKEPGAAKFMHPFLGSREFINGDPRYILYLADATEDELMELPMCRERIEAVRRFRLSSSSAPTRRLAERPRNYHVENMPKGDCIIIPRHSAERREYIPMGFLPADSLCGDSALMIPNAALYHYGVLQSRFHNAWMRTVCGRLKSDYRYSAGVVYNNFVWPDPTESQRAEIEARAQAVLDARDAHPGKSLADLYDPDKMPADLLAAHHALDAAVEAAYGVGFQGDEEKIVAHLFELYAQKVGNQ
ncbi:MAG: DNA methyltransferase, partial [Ellagibacter isourolithinifaciens]|uniref:DNA methyltransferase n=1 Tax=Ellagibacter isourolithinifaciens TaxID=2137581 RepID=UPI002A911FAE